jgi:hypothetical protein
MARRFNSRTLHGTNEETPADHLFQIHTPSPSVSHEVPDYTSQCCAFQVTLSLNQPLHHACGSQPISRILKVVGAALLRWLVACVFWNLPPCRPSSCK